MDQLHYPLPRPLSDHPFHLDIQAAVNASFEKNMFHIEMIKCKGIAVIITTTIETNFFLNTNLTRDQDIDKITAQIDDAAAPQDTETTNNTHPILDPAVAHLEQSQIEVSMKHIVAAVMRWNQVAVEAANVLVETVQKDLKYNWRKSHLHQTSG